jgi:hypothetical protein
MRLVVCIAVLVAARTASAQVQDLGRRLPGGIGLDAGSQAEPGFYLSNRLVWFASERVADRNGNEIPIPGLDLDAFADALGMGAIIKLDRLYLSAGFAVPFAKISISSDLPTASVDRLGLGDVFVQPLQLGTRFTHADVVASYAFSAPTARGATRGIGQSAWTHLGSLGGTVFFDNHRGSRLSALVTYIHNLRKQHIDITRGDEVQIQGGLGARVLRIVDVGVAGYAVWQVTDDTGSELPDVLRGARERAFGLGPEIDVAIPPLRSRVAARFEWDIDGRTRPVGHEFVVTWTFLAVPFPGRQDR